MPHSSHRLESIKQLRCSGFEASLQWLEKMVKGISNFFSTLIAWNHAVWMSPSLRLSGTHHLTSLTRSSALYLRYFISHLRSLWVNHASGSLLVTRLPLCYFCLPTPLGSSTLMLRQIWSGHANVYSAVEALLTEGPLGLLWKLLSPIAAAAAAIICPQPILFNLGNSWTLVALSLTQSLYQPSV